MTKAYEELGIVTTAYYNPTIAESYKELYDEAFNKDIFIKNASGQVAKFLYKGAGPIPFLVSMLDYSNPATQPFWEKVISQSIDLGFRGWMQDYGEYVDPYQIFYNGWNGEEMHNEYVNLYHLATYNYFKKLDPDKFAKG